MAKGSTVSKQPRRAEAASAASAQGSAVTVELTGATGEEPDRTLGEFAAGDDIGAAELTRQVADTVRSLRKSRGYSLDELAARSGVSRASLSQIETAKTNPTIAILWKIAAGLGVPFNALLGEQQTDRVQLLRRQDQQVLRSADGRMESRPLLPAGATPNVEVYELRLAPRSVNVSEPHARGTAEHIVVLTGVLRLRVGDEMYDLAAGDCVYFVADVAHAYENPGRVEARYQNTIVYAR